MVLATQSESLIVAYNILIIIIFFVTRWVSGIGNHDGESGQADPSQILQTFIAIGDQHLHQNYG